jgi:chromate reductase
MTEQNFKICAISGSLRKGSFNTAALRAAQELAPPGTTIEIAPIGDLPLYNEDLRVGGSFPPPAERLREAIRAADAVLFASPEYNFSISGVLKNALDWASRPPDQPFNGKAYAIIGASSGLVGTARGQFQLRQTMVGVNAFTINVPQVLIASSAQKFDAEGKLTDKTARDLIAQLLVALVAFAGKLKS